MRRLEGRLEGRREKRRRWLVNVGEGRRQAGAVLLGGRS